MVNGTRPGSPPRLRIGLILESLEESYQALFWPGVLDYAHEHGVQAMVFVSTSQHQLNRFDIHYQVVADFIDTSLIDALIVMTGAMSEYSSPDEVIQFCRRFAPLPVVSIAMALPGIPSIVVDNKAGVHEALNHLIETHGTRRIAFVKGPDGHGEAQERLNAYYETLAMHGIGLDENLIVPGHFSRQSGYEAVAELWDRRSQHVEAIVAADDETALGVMTALQERSIAVPESVKVIGFDNIPQTRFVTPPMTTIMQPLYQQGRTAAELACELARGETVASPVRLATSLVVRQSCGCLSRAVNMVKTRLVESLRSSSPDQGVEAQTPAYLIHTMAMTLEHVSIEEPVLYDMVERVVTIVLQQLDADVFVHTLHGILLEYHGRGGTIGTWHEAMDLLLQYCVKTAHRPETLNRIHYQFHMARILIDEVMHRQSAWDSVNKEERYATLREISQSLISTHAVGNLMSVFCTELPRLNVECCYLSLYEGEGGRESLISTWHLPGLSRLVLAVEGAQRILRAGQDPLFSTSALVPDDIDLFSTHSILIFMPLFFREEHFGFILFGHRHGEDASMYETLRGHLGSALKIAGTLEKLNSMNRELHTLSTRDDLTGLYNRRGFISLGEQYLAYAAKAQEHFLLFFADLDGLKRINDTWGHVEGDFAIQSTGRILHEVFRKRDIVARIGGDEFTVLAVGADEQMVPYIHSRLQQELERFNAASNKPYALSISIGLASTPADRQVVFARLLEDADRMLYEQKVCKKSGSSPSQSPDRKG